jgi:DNA-directed RNA polymerase subunit RPC12/RpoP
MQHAGIASIYMVCYSCHGFKYDVTMMKLNEDERAWEQAGLQENAGLGRPLSTRALYVPQTIELRGTRANRHIQWLPRPSNPVNPTATLLDQFVRLGDATEERILQYARRWGVLGICVHGLPSSHNPPVGDPTRDRAACFAMTVKDVDPSKPDEPVEHYEWLDDWKRFSNASRSLLNIATRLYNGKPGFPQDWQRVVMCNPFMRPPRIPWWEPRVGVDRSQLSGVMNDWLLWGGVRPTMEYGRDFWSVKLTGHGLFGVLAVYLSLSIAKTGGFAICTSCSRPYLPRRQPNANRRQYCPECGRKAAMRDAARDYRRRKGDGR